MKTLQTISFALGVPVGWFFRDQSPAENPQYVIRANEHRRLTYTALWTDDYLREINYLITPRLDCNVAMGLTTLASGASSGDDAFSLESDVAAYVLKGKLTLVVDAKTYVLEPGDAYFIPEGVVHRYRNSSSEDVLWLWSIAPPRF